MALEASWLTKHERGVILAALADYRRRQHVKSTTAARADTRARAGANEYVAGDLIRQLADK